MAQPGFGLQVDVAGYTRTLDAIGRKALPAAGRETLNKAAFDAQASLTRHAHETFDRPKPFTTRAFVVDKAQRGTALDELSSAVRAKGQQAAYLRLQIEGGVRTAADPGVRGAADVMTYSVRQDKHGGIPRGFLRALTAERRAEAGKRALFAEHKDQLAEQMAWEDDLAFEAAVSDYDATAFGMNRKGRGKKPKLKARRQVTYAAVHKPGIFFGEVNGVKGYWRRPKRTAPAGPRKKGVRQVKDVATPTLLLRVQDAAVYKPRFRYNEVIAASYTRFGAQVEFARELERQIAHLHAKAAAGPSTPSFRMPFGGRGR